MGALDPRTPVDDVRRLSVELREIGRRLDLLEAPSGTQAFRTVTKLQALVADIQSQIDQWAATRWTNAQIEAQINSRVNAAIAAAFAGNVTITGSLAVNGGLAAASLSTGGSLTAGGSLYAGGAVTLPDVYNTALGGSRKTVWVDSAGRIGNTA